MIRRRLGVMQLVHARSRILPTIWRQLRSLTTNVHLQIVLSKPTTDVIAAVNLMTKYGIGSKNTIDVLEAPFPPLSPGRPERFMELRQWQLEQIRHCSHGCIWDDDHILEYPHEFSNVLREDFDLCYAEKLFFWGSPKTYTTHIPNHNSVFAFRMLPGDRFPLDRVIMAPEKVHDGAKKVIQLQHKLLDYGYLSEQDRQRCWCDYKSSGKIDAATVALLREPTLHEYDYTLVKSPIK